MEQRETSTLHKFKETFWTTKQAVIQKLGKKEDEHVVASDSELDSKLEVNQLKRTEIIFSWYWKQREWMKDFYYPLALKRELK